LVCFSSRVIQRRAGHFKAGQRRGDGGVDLATWK